MEKDSFLKLFRTSKPSPTYILPLPKGGGGLEKGKRGRIGKGKGKEDWKRKGEGEDLEKGDFLFIYNFDFCRQSRLRHENLDII